MARQLQDRLNEWGHRLFIGRHPEVALFRTILDADDSSIQVLYIFGPGGIGKSTLLNELSYHCRAAGIPSSHLDGRHVDAKPEPFLSALAQTLGPIDGSPIDALERESRRRVIFVDTYEELKALDDWVRVSFLPQLPENVILVLAGRDPPSPRWRVDPGLQSLMRSVPLRNLNPDESRDYLGLRLVPAKQFDPVLRFTHGHPLALALVADVCAQRPEIQFQPEAAVDVIQVLLDQLVQDVPTPAHRAAMQASSLVRALTEPLLADLLAAHEARDLFEWLRGLSFIESGPAGIRPHDLAREVLATDLRWRNPGRFAEIHQRARNYYLRHLYLTLGEEQQRLLMDYIFLHRNNPAVQPFFNWQASAGVLTHAMRAVDLPMLLQMVRRHEGADAMRIAVHWFERQPKGVIVFRHEGGAATGFMAMVALQRASADDRAVDPAVAAAHHALQQYPPLRPGDVATLVRFWMAGDSYQDVSLIQSLVFVNAVHHYLLEPGLAFTFFPCANPEFWSPVFAYADLMRLPEADFEIDGRHYGVYGHDWRGGSRSPMSWLALLAQREMSITPKAPAAAVLPLLVLSQPDFAAAVRDGLRHLLEPSALIGNPLLRSRIIIEATAGALENSARVTTLQTLLRQTVEELRASPRSARCYRALYHTYIAPAPTHEQAAELLDLPYSTYRRHLKEGIHRVTDLLWQREGGELSALSV